MKNHFLAFTLASVSFMPLAAQDSDEPRFRFFDGKLTVRAGGQAKATASFDWGNPVDNPDCFAVSSIPMNLAPGNGGKFQISARQSSLHLDLRWLEGEKDEARVFIYGLFLGQNYGFVLEEAFATYRGIKAGYGYGLFYDAAAVFPTIDYEGPNAYVSALNGFIDYEHSFNSGWSLGAGLEMPMESITTGRYTSSVSERIPDIPVYGQYSWGENNDSHVRVSGIMRTLVYRDLSSERNRNIPGWGIQLSGTAGVTPRLRAYYEAAYGSGIASYFQDMTGLGLDLVPDSKKRGKMQPVNVWGAFAGFSYNLTDRITLTAGYSFLKARSSDYSEDSWGNLYKKGQYANVNMVYNITDCLQCGAEYIYGQRTDNSGLHRHDNRIQTMLSFSF